MFSEYEAPFSQQELQADWSQMANRLGATGSEAVGDGGVSASGSSGGGLLASGTAKLLAVIVGVASIGTAIYFSLPKDESGENPDSIIINKVEESETQNAENDQNILVATHDGDVADGNSAKAQLSRKVLPLSTDNAADESDISTDSDNNNDYNGESSVALVVGDSENQSSDKRDDADEVDQEPVRLWLSEAVVCEGAPIRLRLENTRAGNIYTYSIKHSASEKSYSDGGQITGPVMAAIDQPGQYSIEVIELGEDKSVKQVASHRVLVMESPKAIKIEHEQSPCDEFAFSAVTTGSTQYEWQIGNKIHQGNQVEVKFAQLGSKQVQLVAKNGDCADTIIKQIDFFQSNITAFKPVVGTVFTPTGDGFNDEFDVFEQNKELLRRNGIVKVFDRFGNIVFESSEDDRAWNGKKFNSGDLCPNGTYFYQIAYDENCTEGGREQLQGSIYLTR